MFVGETFKEGRYTALSFLGEGHYSTVWRVRDELSGEHCAMKVRQRRLQGLCCEHHGIGAACGSAACGIWCGARCCCHATALLRAASAPHVAALPTLLPPLPAAPLPCRSCAALPTMQPPAAMRWRCCLPFGGAIRWRRATACGCWTRLSTACRAGARTCARSSSCWGTIC